jgi:hypothetical protein
MAKLMADASNPPAALPTGFSAVAGYIGGGTPHVWTPAEWRRFGGLAKLPIWVQSNPGQRADGLIEAGRVLQRLYALQVPRGSTVALDLETAAAPAYVIAFHSVLSFFGYRVWVYGSRSTVFANPECDGYWVADYTGEPHWPAGPAVRACQYQSGPAVDRSVVRWWQWRNRLWR